MLDSIRCERICYCLEINDLSALYCHHHEIRNVTEISYFNTRAGWLSCWSCTLRSDTISGNWKPFWGWWQMPFVLLWGLFFALGMFLVFLWLFDRLGVLAWWTSWSEFRVLWRCGQDKGQFWCACCWMFSGWGWGLGSEFGQLMECAVVGFWGYFTGWSSRKSPLYLFFWMKSQIPYNMPFYMSKSTAARLYCNSNAVTCFHFTLSFSSTRRNLGLVTLSSFLHDPCGECFACCVLSQASFRHWIVFAFWSIWWCVCCGCLLSGLWCQGF